MLECICWAGGILGFQEIQRLDTQARKVPAIEMQPHFSRASEPPPPGRHNGRAGGADEGVGGSDEEQADRGVLAGGRDADVGVEDLVVAEYGG